jgi:hypothetical protein
VIVLLAVSCTPVSTQRYPLYQYSLQAPTKPLSPNELLSLVWEPRLASEGSAGVTDIQLCVALFGPWETVEALKRAAAPDTRSCPPPGAIATSQTLRTSSASGARLAADIRVPSVPGFYDLLQISVYDPGNSTSGGAVIEVR